MQATKLIRELNPSHLLIPDIYTKPPLLLKHKSDLMIDYVSSYIDIFIIKHFVTYFVIK